MTIRPFHMSVMRPAAALMAVLLVAASSGCRRATKDPAELADMAGRIRNIHLTGRVFLENPAQAEPRRGLAWEQARLEAWILEDKYRLDLEERDGLRLTRLGEPGREHLLQRFAPQPDLPLRPPEAYTLTVEERPDLWAVLIQAGQSWASPLPPLRFLGRLVPAAAPAPFPHHPAPLAWFDLRPAGDGFPSDLVEYRRLRLGLGPEDGLIHAWVGEFPENPKDSKPWMLWRVVVFDRHETGTVRAGDLLLPPEAAGAAWTDGQGRPIPAPRSCIQRP
jgi:hypothetical protein